MHIRTGCALIAQSLACARGQHARSWYHKVNSSPQWTVFWGFVQELCRAGVVVFVSLFTGDHPAGLLGAHWNVVERLWSEAIPTTLLPVSTHYAESQPRLGWPGQ